MQQISEAFKEALNGSHVVIVRADVLDPNGNVIQTLPVESGYVTVDPDSDVVRSGRFNVVAEPDEEDAFPLIPEDMFDTLGLGHNEIRVYRGVRLGQGDSGIELHHEDDFTEGEHDWTQESNGSLVLEF